MDDTQTTWERIEQAELEIEGVSPGTGFGRSEGLRIRGKIYAINKDGELILKLPGERVEALIDSGTGRAWGPGPGRIMREWVAIPGTRNPTGRRLPRKHEPSSAHGNGQARARDHARSGFAFSSGRR